MHSKSEGRGFTLIEILIAVAIVAFIATIIVVVFNPPELLRRSRDATRLSDLATLNRGIELYLTDIGGSIGDTSTTYLSLPSIAATTTAGDDCAGMGLPALSAGLDYHCAASSTYRNIDGTGWVPVDFTRLSYGDILSRLPVDPVNETSSGLYYTYNVGSFEFSAAMESVDFSASGSKDAVTTDGGQYSDRYETGSDRFLLPYDPSSATTSASATLAVSNVSASGMTTSTVTIAWTTNLTADSRVNYGTSTSYGSSSYSGTLVTSHSIPLASLASGTTYHYQVQSVSGSSTATSSDQTFATTGGTNSPPNAPSEDAPLNNATGTSITPVFKMTATDANSDNLKYKVTIYSNALCSTVVQTDDETVSQTGWSGQNASSGTAYTSGSQGTFTVQSALTASTTYYWVASAIDPAGSNTWTNSLTCNQFTTKPLPGTPGTPSYSSISTTSVTVSWTAATNADYYNLDDSTSGSGTYGLVASTTGTSQNVTGLAASTTYWFKVQGANTSGNGSWSATSSVTTASTTSPDTTPPSPNPMTWSAAPYAASISSISMTATTATDSSTPVYYLFTFIACGADGGTGGTSSSYQTSTVFTDTGLQANQCYSYSVTAKDSASPANVGSSSAISSAYTLANVPGTPTVVSPTTSTLTFTNNANGNPTSNPATLFAAQATSTSPTDSNWNGEWLTSVGAPTSTAAWLTNAQLTNLVLTNLQPNTTYTFTAKARNNAVSPTETAEGPTAAGLTLPGTPGAPSYSSVTTSSLTASWSAPTNGAAYYNLDSATSSGGPYNFAASTTATSTGVTGLAASTTYWFEVQGVNNSGNGPWGSASNVTTSSTAPSNSPPGIPSEDAPLNNATGTSFTPTFMTTATDTNSDNLQYKITIYSNALCSSVVQTDDETVSQTGWSGQNASSGTAYTAGTQATYVVQSALTASTTYYWVSSAIDPAGSNTWTNSATCNQFTTGNLPGTPGTPTYSGIGTSTITVNWASSTFTNYYSLERGTTGNSFSQITTTTAVTYNDTGLATGTTYYYRVIGTNSLGTGSYSASSSASTTAGGGTTNVIVITSTASTTWTVPANWNSASNTIEVVGGGGNGGTGFGSGGSKVIGAGGGGGGYSKVSNLNISGTITIHIGGVASDTWFNGTSCAGASVCAKGGASGNSTNGTGGAGGATSTAVGTVRYSGGSGAASSTGGGGGAAGMFGSASNATSSNGTVGDNNSGGSGGPAGNPPTAGGNGTEWGSYGSGGGGGAANAGNNTAGAAGGTYGGGGGAGYASGGTGGAGQPGIIVITYYVPG